MNGYYCKTENTQDDNNYKPAPNIKKANRNSYRELTERKLNELVEELDEFTLSSKNFFEERENEDKEYNNITSSQNFEIVQFNKITNNEIEKIKSYYNEKKKEAKEKINIKKQEFIQNVKNLFDKNYKSYTYSTKFQHKKNELDKSMEECLDFSLNGSYDINSGLYFKNGMLKKKYENLSKLLEKLQKEDKIEYNRKKKRF